MKRILNIIPFILLTMLIAVGCDPQHSTSADLGAIPTPEEVSFELKPSAETPNIVLFENTSSRSGVVVWDLGNGATLKGDDAKGVYPYAGEYKAVMTLYTTGGSLAVEKTFKIDQDNLSILDTKPYRDLTGGPTNAVGKVWVLDQYNNFAEEVKNATGKDIRGHMGLGESGSYSQGWWGALPNDKKDWSLYAHKFTFKQGDLSLKVENEGTGYGRAAAHKQLGGYPLIEYTGDDAIFKYAGGTYNFSIDESAKYPIIKLTNKGYLGYDCGTSQYELLYQTDKVMALRVNNTIENQDWVFVYCLEELNVEPPKPIIPVKAVELIEDFEKAKPSVEFVGEEMGTLFSLSYQNPAPVPVNQSSKAALYHKSDKFYTNLSFTADGYKFDLKEQNKIKLLVFIPSYNDYTTENAVAGDWIANKKLLSQVAVKLQDSEKGGNAWETQTEIVKADLVKDQWLALEFDFSAVKDREDYDKIVIQFGAEGHAGEGIFFLDNFSFTK